METRKERRAVSRTEHTGNHYRWRHWKLATQRRSTAFTPPAGKDGSTSLRAALASSLTRVGPLALVVAFEPAVDRDVAEFRGEPQLAEDGSSPGADVLASRGAGGRGRRDYVRMKEREV